MNKWQIICPVIAMLIAAMVVMNRKAADNQRAFLNAHARMISEDLIQSTNSEYLSEMSPQLKLRLSSLYRFPSSVSGLAMGDVPSPEGDGSASFNLLLRNSAGEIVGVRFGRMRGTNKFKVLSYWSVTEVNGPKGDY